jgi:hypothetical protein
MSRKDAPSWADFNAGRHKPVPSYPTSRMRVYNAPVRKPQAPSIEVNEDLSQTGVERVLGAFAGAPKSQP